MSSGVFRQYPPPQQRAPSIAPFVTPAPGTPPSIGTRAEFIRREEFRMPIVQRNGIAALLPVASAYVPPAPVQAAVYIRELVEVITMSVSEFGGGVTLDAPVPFASTQPQRRDNDFPYHELQSTRTYFTAAAPQTYVPPIVSTTQVAQRWPYDLVIGKAQRTAAQPLDAPIQPPSTVPQRRDSDFPYHELAALRTNFTAQAVQSFTPPSASALPLSVRWPYAELIGAIAQRFTIAQPLGAPIQAPSTMPQRRESDFPYHEMLTTKPVFIPPPASAYVPPVVIFQPLAMRWPYELAAVRVVVTASQSLDAPIGYINSQPQRRDSDFPYHALQSLKTFFTPQAVQTVVPTAPVFVPQVRQAFNYQPPQTGIAHLIVAPSGFVPPSPVQIAIQLRAANFVLPISANVFTSPQALAGYVPPAAVQPHVPLPWPYALVISRMTVRFTESGPIVFHNLPPSSRVFRVPMEIRMSLVPRSQP